MSQTNQVVKFNNIDLTTVAGLTVLATNPFKPAKRSLLLYQLARASMNKATAGYFTSRDITISVAISQPTRDLAEKSLDTLLSLLPGLEKDLIVLQSGGNRRYVASYSDYNITVEGGGYLQLDLIFLCSNTFGYDTNPSLITNQSGLTNGYTAFSWTQGGSVETQAPVITLQFTVLGNPGTSQTVNIINATTNQTLSINRIWAAGDIIVIDCDAMTVKVNGVDANFTGGMLTFGLGKQYLSVSDSFSSRTFNINAYVYNRYY